MTATARIESASPPIIVSSQGDPDDRDDEAASAAIQHLAQRFSASPKILIAPGPSHEDLLQAARLALRAPDHGGLRPYRFVHVGVDQRPRLGELFAADAARRGLSAVDIERARDRAHNGPVLLALVGRIDEGRPDVPAHEQLLCVGAALMNFLNALHLAGYGAKTLSGASVRDAEIQRSFCASRETLLAWILAGTPRQTIRARYADDPSMILSDW